ncbi:MAG: hypothetical protein IJZ39_10290 [Oscillospiraceae bacterium]|nr:hypothetical protein [Oscillospiraceae bacterium]
MKKRTIIICLIFSLLLGGCAPQAMPETAADGTPWGADWTNLGTVAGVEPLDGWTAQRNEDVLAAEGMYFAAWSCGTPAENDDGETVYPAQIFLLLQECDSPQAADDCLNAWQALAQENYIAEAPVPAGSFTLLPYRFPDDSGHFSAGISAFGIHGNYAVNAEISCAEDFPLDLQETLTDFLNNIHYAN